METLFLLSILYLVSVMGCCGCAEDENDSEAPQKGTNQQRSCTDVIWLALFIVFWLFMVSYYCFLTEILDSKFLCFIGIVN